MEPFRLELPTGLPVGSVNAYLFTEPEPILVDTGIKRDESWLALEEGLAKYGLDVSDISRVIITHAHVDHYGQAGAIAARSDADIWISQLGAPWLKQSIEFGDQRDGFYRDFFLPAVGLPREDTELVLSGLQALNDQAHPIPTSRIHTFSPNGTLQMGGRAWKVLHTPGHASMQTCIYEPLNHLLLSADMLLATTPTPVVESPPDGTRNRVPALPLFLQSLDKIESLEIDKVLPGHGRSFSNHQVVIDRQRERISQRKRECLDWVSRGYHLPLTLLEKMYAHQPAGFRLTGLWMLIGYLDLLEREGAVRRETTNGVWHYYTTA